MQPSNPPDGSSRADGQGTAEGNGRAAGRTRRRSGTVDGGVTIRDVARHAGVSIATVSRALRGHANVTEATRQRVLASVTELRFTPSRLGVSLAEQRHAANGIVFPDLSGPYFAEVVLGYEAVAAELGRSVLILSTHGRDAARERVMELAGRVDGLVVLGRTVSDAVVREIADRGTPLVLLARPTFGDVDSVNAENVDTAGALARHLVDDGHTRLLFVGDPASSHDIGERWQGFTAALAEAGRPEPAQVFPPGFGEDAGVEVARGLLAEELPDAVVCANDELALGVLSELRAAAVDVPGRVAVTGWDDVMAARYAGLTTVRQPMCDLGAAAARALDARIAGDGDPARHLVLPTQLVVRNSCAHHKEERR
ncbi:MAG: LacI family transcriptional regulator [Actinomycetota bacterium]|nr:LacI family transcriptional regulator [Actinomycetota bacterium]